MMTGMTGPGGHFQVNTDDLVSHAGEVDRIGDGLTVAAQAGEAVQVDAGAYGRLCQVVPALLDALQLAMVDGMHAAATSAHETAASLRSVAASYDAADRNAVDRLRGTR